MKTHLFRTFMVTVLAASAAFAQNSTRLQANVPFDFIAGNQALPAGQYALDQGPAPGIVMIRSADGKSGAFVLTYAAFSAVAHDKPSLVFHRYGSTYYLSEVWGPGNDGRKLPPAARERDLAAKVVAPGNTTIAALR